jgi:hypothetical protein
MSDIVQSFWQGKISPMELLCIQSFLNNGHPFHLYTYEGHLDGIPKGVIIKDAAEILSKIEFDKFKHIEQSADLFRAMLLLKHGGWWVDMDMICLRPFDFMQEYVIGGIDSRKDIFQIASIKAPKGSPAFQYWCDVIMGMTDTQRQKVTFDGIGPMTMPHIVSKFRLEKFVTSQQVFDPVCYKGGWNQIEKIIDPIVTWDLGSSFGVHLFHAAWNSFKHSDIQYIGAETNKVYPEGCLYEQLKRRVYTTPKVSIVMSTFNRAVPLKNTLESIASQSYKDFEVIVVDDGNDSETPELCRQPWPFLLKYFRLNRRVGLLRF